MIEFKVVIEGISNLLQSNPASMGLKPPESPEQIPAWLEAQTYRGEDGFLYHPAGGLRNCFFKGTTGMKIKKTAASSALKGIVSIFPEESLLLRREGKPIKDYGQLTTSAVNQKNKARIITYRPMITLPWEIEFIFEVNEKYFDINDTAISQLKGIWDQAGMKVGLGCWRPEKSGLYGRFKLKEFNKE